MNQNPWQKDYIGRRDPKVIREENATRNFQRQLQRIHQQPAPEAKPANHIEEELKNRQRDMNILRNNPMNRKNRPF